MMAGDSRAGDGGSRLVPNPLQADCNHEPLLGEWPKPASDGVLAPDAVRALDRAQELLYFLNQGIARSRLPPSLQIFLDSLMAISVTGSFA
jgi:hypothetical protein